MGEASTALTAGGGKNLTSALAHTALEELKAFAILVLHPAPVYSVVTHHGDLACVPVYMLVTSQNFWLGVDGAISCHPPLPAPRSLLYLCFALTTINTNTDQPSAMDRTRSTTLKRTPALSLGNACCCIWTDPSGRRTSG
jgi:hypothetical protein